MQKEGQSIELVFYENDNGILERADNSLGNSKQKRVVLPSFKLLCQTDFLDSDRTQT